jgi:GTPase SAR1 family protein
VYIYVSLAGFDFIKNRISESKKLTHKLMAHTNKNTSADHLLKVIIVGDSGVGKTNLLTYFCEGVFK